MRRFVAVATVLAAGLWGSGLAGVSGAVGENPGQVGAFAPPFEEPGPRCVTRPDGTQVCKPAGSASIVLANGRILYWNNLEGTENIKLNTVAEAGDAAANSQSRVLTLGPDGTPSWSVPSPSD